MTLSLKEESDDLLKIQQITDEIAAAGRTVMATSAKITAATIEQKVREDIAAAGNFGGRWTEGFRVSVDESGETITLNGTMDAKYWQVFQYGATIVGKPLLFFAPSKPVFSLKPGATQPKVISKHQVSIPKKFHIFEIAEEEASKADLALDGVLKQGS